MTYNSPMELVLMIGIQASGKTTFCRKRFIDSHMILSLDILKTRNREWILFESCLESKTRTVVDNTNPTIDDRKRFIDLAKKHKYKIIGYYFECNVDESIKRNRTRNDRVPDIAVFSTKKKLEEPSFAEGFDELYFVKSTIDGFTVKDWKE